MFIVISGRFEVFIAGRSEPLTDLPAGEPIGEIGFFAGGRRTATIAAARNSVVLEFDRPAFDKIAKASNSIYEAIVRSLAQRLAESTAADDSGGAASSAASPRAILSPADRPSCTCMSAGR